MFLFLKMNNFGYHNPDNNNQEHFDYEGDLPVELFPSRDLLHRITNKENNNFYIPKDEKYEKYKNRYKIFYGEYINNIRNKHFEDSFDNQVMKSASGISHANAIFIDYEKKELHHWRSYYENNSKTKALLNYICYTYGLRLKQHTSTKQENAPNCVIFSFWYMLMKTSGYSFDDIERNNFNDEKSEILIENMKSEFEIFRDRKFTSRIDLVHEAYYMYCFLSHLRPLLSSWTLSELMSFSTARDMIDSDREDMEIDKMRHPTQTLFFFTIIYFDDGVINDIFIEGKRDDFDYPQSIINNSVFSCPKISLNDSKITK